MLSDWTDTRELGSEGRTGSDCSRHGALGGRVQRWGCTREREKGDTWHIVLGTVEITLETIDIDRI